MAGRTTGSTCFFQSHLDSWLQELTGELFSALSSDPCPLEVTALWRGISVQVPAGLQLVAAPACVNCGLGAVNLPQCAPYCPLVHVSDCSQHLIYERLRIRVFRFQHCTFEHIPAPWGQLFAAAYMALQKCFQPFIRTLGSGSTHLGVLKLRPKIL